VGGKDSPFEESFEGDHISWVDQFCCRSSRVNMSQYLWLML
jgi:hypothetical protein